MTKLASDAAHQLHDLSALASTAGVRYRNYTLVTNNQRVMAELANHVVSTLGGEILDVLDGSIPDRALPTLDRLALVDWVKERLTDRAPRFLLHVDAILSTWRRSADQRVWWEQAAMIEHSGPLFIATARRDIDDVARWGKVGSLWVNTAQVDVFAPPASAHFGWLREDRSR